jgi:hypothetical protein
MIHDMMFCSMVWVLSGSPYELKSLAEVRKLLQQGATLALISCLSRG